MGIINPYAKGEAASTQSDGPVLRLLACGKCKTVEVLDDYTGPQERAEEFDVILNVAVERHQDGVERIPHAPAALVRVKQSDWGNEEINQQIRQQIANSFDPNAETGLGSEAYAMRDNFSADAMTCWERHLKTPTCPDYMTSPKQLVPNTTAERREAGIPKFDPANPATQRFLCEYCPVHSMVTSAKRKQAGMYDR